MSNMKLYSEIIDIASKYKTQVHNYYIKYSFLPKNQQINKKSGSMRLAQIMTVCKCYT